MLSFLTFIVAITFSKILNIWDMGRVIVDELGTHTAIAQVQNVSYPQMRRGAPFKRCRAKHLEETCNYPDF